MHSTSHPPAAHPQRALRGASVAVVLALGACGSSSDLLAPEDPLATHFGAVSATVSAVFVSGAGLAEILRVTLDEEYRAEAIYLGVMKDFGSVLPFRNIAKAERQHAKNILALYTVRAHIPHFAEAISLNLCPDRIRT